MIDPIIGKRINLRDVEVSDAEFILSLRLDADLSQYLSATAADVEKQRAWIENYKSRENEWYFIIENKQREPVGTVRIYDVQSDSFCWGSWIIVKSARSYASFESAILLYDYAFFTLGFAKSHFDVRKENDKVVTFHQRFGAETVSADEENYYFNFTREAYQKTREKYSKVIERS